jgi:ABC-type transport system involved in multi-copper enzyme maturation permease subunit
LDLLQLIVALFFIALVIAYASIVIPILLASFVGFLLAIWLYAHLVDGVYIMGSWIKKKVRLHS